MAASSTLDGAFFVVAPLLLGAGKSMWTALCIGRSHLPGDKVRTQRLRYGLAMSGLAISLACGILLLSMGSVADIIARIEEWRQRAGELSIVAYAVVGFIPGSLLLAPMMFYFIYRNHAVMAYRCNGRMYSFPTYCTMASLRAGQRQLVCQRPGQRTWTPIN